MPYIIEIEPREDDVLHATLTHAVTGEVIELDRCACGGAHCFPNGSTGALDDLWADIREIVLGATR